jgi:hypothetical protein
MDVRRELDLINKHLDRHTRGAGESIIWYQFLPLGEGSTYDDIYDESPQGPTGLSYEPGIVLPTVYVEEIEDTNRAIDTGRQPTQNLNVLVTMENMVKSGIKHPNEYQPHMKDMFFYDGRYFSVVEYRVRGRLRNDVVVSIDGKETYIDQEHVNDLFLPDHAPSIQDFPWPDTFANR